MQLLRFKTLWGHPGTPEQAAALAVAAGFDGLEAPLHRPALLAAPIVLAAFETLLFGLTVPAAPLLEESQRGLATGLLIALAWVINGAVPVRLWLRAGAPWPIKR